MDSLISLIEKKNIEKDTPLAARLRATSLDEVVGQEDILGKDKLLYKMIKTDSISSIILYGPPGTGKTTIAKVIAETTKANFVSINATNASKDDMKEVVTFAKAEIAKGKKTILFIDEIHRFNKSQQDYLLPFVEDATLILIGATTENPYFEVNGALISRSRIFELKRLGKDDIKKLIIKAVTDNVKGLGALNISIDDAAVDFLSDMSNGDARIALNAIELASRTITDKKITLDVAKDCIGKHGYSYDKDGDIHYDTISAFIKSMRGSDPDAAVYYLARMLEAGEDIKFIARRMMILASEDIGLADPMALVIATSCANAIERIGMPESNLILSETCIYLAKAKKSNACCIAIENAQAEVRNSGNLPIPKHLQDSHYKGAKNLNRGIGYKYPHDYPGHFVRQQYLPDEIIDRKFYEEN